jgi:hypothetical protein
MIFLNASPAEYHLCRSGGLSVSPGHLTVTNYLFGSSLLPSNTFHMIIHGNREFMTATGASSLKYFLSVSGGHSSSKSMNAQASMDFRLVSAFWHTSTLSILNSKYYRPIIISYSNKSVKRPGDKLSV